MPIPPSHFISVGWEVWTGYEDLIGQKYNEDKFRALFGCSPEICSSLWLILESSIEAMFESVRPRHLMWTLSYLKLYLPIRVAARAFHCDENTFQRWIRVVVDCLAKAKRTKIRWENRYMGITDPSSGVGLIRVSVDGTDFRINEPTPFDPIWYSHKFRGPGVRYEVVVAIRTGWIVSVRGPFPCGGWPDLRIARGWLFPNLDEGETVIADGGYSTGGEFTIVPRHLNEEQRRLHSVIRARHEIVNRRLKQWHILGGGRYRSDVSSHRKIFNAVAVITQVILEEESIPFEIEGVL